MNLIGPAALFLIPWIVVAQERPRVQGLREGESAVVLSAATLDTIVPRILDALTGQPIPVATVELWTEDLGGVGDLVDRGVTAAGGTVLLNTAVSGRKAEKALVRASGFASTVTGLGDLVLGTIALAPQQTLEGRIVDLEGRPVAMAIVRSRQSCPHAPSAVQTRTDPDGRFLLPEFPVGEVELDVLAPGHGPLPSLSVSDMRVRLALTGRNDIHVPLRRPVELRVLDGDLQPAVGRRVAVTSDRPIQSAWVDEEGRCHFLPLSRGREPSFYLMQGEEIPLHPVVVPGDGLITLAPLGSEGRSPERGSVEVVLDIPPTLEGFEVPVQVVDGDGVAYFGPGSHDVARGEVHVMVGRAFSGIAEQSFSLAAGDEPQRVSAAVRREPVLMIHSPDQPLWVVHIQVGEDSITTVFRGASEERRVPVPSGRRVVVFGEQTDGTLRRVILDRVDEDTEVRLDNEETILRPPLDRQAAGMARIQVQVVDDRGEQVNAPRVRVVDFEHLSEIRQEDTRILVDLPAGPTVTLRITSPDHSTRMVPVSLAPGQEGELQVELPRTPSVVLRGPVNLVRGGGCAWTRRADGTVIGRPAPGALRLLVHRSTGQPIEVRLNVGPGEVREVVVP